MIRGAYRKGKEQLPRVLHISIARYNRNHPEKDEILKFLVSIHEEGTGITWQRNVTVNQQDERFFLDKTKDLYLWSLNRALTPKDVINITSKLGERLYKVFIGPEGEEILADIPPTAVLLNTDETILNLPWELIRNSGIEIVLQIPFGRLVTTRIIPRSYRDPLNEDTVVRILAVANPTLDLAAGEKEIEALRELEGHRHGYSIDVKVLQREIATKSAFAKMLATNNFDMIHFSGHGFFDPTAPEMSAIRFSDGILSADEVPDLKWKSPPYMVFNSACESGRAAGGKRLVSSKNHSNGLAAAFIAAGVSAYAGYFWPVTDTGASLFAKVFYKTLFERENVGIAFLEARKSVILQLGEFGDLTGYSAVLFGDAASEHRRDLAKAY